MLTYIGRRLLHSIPVLVISSFLSFVFVSLAGDPLGQLRVQPKISQLTLQNLSHSTTSTARSPSATGTGSRTCSRTSSARR